MVFSEQDIVLACDFCIFLWRVTMHLCMTWTTFEAATCNEMVKYGQCWLDQLLRQVDMHYSKPEESNGFMIGVCKLSM